MLRKYIKDQLDKCCFADLSNFDPTTNTFMIKKYSKPVYSLQHCYVVNLLPHLLQPNSVLATNWNSGAIPPYHTLKIYVSKLFGRMIYVDSVAYDVATQQEGPVWSGWLPIDEINQLAAF